MAPVHSLVKTFLLLGPTLLVLHTSSADAAPKNCKALKARVRFACNADPSGDVCSKKRNVYHRCLEKRIVKKVSAQINEGQLFCFALFEPTCGKFPNGKLALFGNSCEAAALSALPVDLSLCPELCATLFKPVCGVDSYGNLQTFPSECSAHSKGSSVVHKGSCLIN